MSVVGVWYLLLFVVCLGVVWFILGLGSGCCLFIMVNGSEFVLFSLTIWSWGYCCAIVFC